MVCKMVKKAVVGTALGAGALALIFGTAAPSYVKTAFHKVRTSAKGAVSPEFEIERARNEIASLRPAMDDAVETLARAKSEVKQLNNEIADAREELNREGKNIQALSEHLNKGDFHPTSGVAYTEKALKADLCRRMDHYNLLKSTLSQKQETLNTLQKNVVSAEQGLEALKGAERDLTARVDGAQARLNQIKAARATKRYTFDDSAIGQAKRTVAEVEKKLEHMATVDDLREKYLDDAVTSATTVDPSRDVLKEIEAEFGSAPAKGEKY